MYKHLAKQANKYIKCVNKYLICKRKTKKTIDKSITDSINDYCDKHPDCDFEDIKIYLGSPSKLSEQLMATIDKQEVKSVKKKRFISTIIFCSMILIIIIILIALFIHGLTLQTATVYQFVSTK